MGCLWPNWIRTGCGAAVVVDEEGLECVHREMEISDGRESQMNHKSV